MLGNKAKIWFERDDDDDKKRLILDVTGSNPVLKDKTLLIEAKKPFLFLQKGLLVRNWWAVVDDIRIFCRNRHNNLAELRETFVRLKQSARKAA